MASIGGNEHSAVDVEGKRNGGRHAVSVELAIRSLCWVNSMNDDNN